jgi:hypothetical protein
VKKEEMENNESEPFLGIDKVRVTEENPMGSGLVAELRYKSPKDDLVILSVKLPDETKESFTEVKTMQEVAPKRSSIFFIPYQLKGKITLEGRLGKSKAIYSFFFRHGEIIPAF